MGEKSVVSLQPKIELLWQEIKFIEAAIEVLINFDEVGVLKLVKQYEEVTKELVDTLDQQFKYEEENNLPRNLRLHKLRKDLKNA